ncbi:MAG: hypothetical protein IKS33_01480 [Bacteroidales bacterium]|nr:hypothetical protein [Bacteroidales bacterium]
MWTLPDNNTKSKKIIITADKCVVKPLNIAELSAFCQKNNVHIVHSDKNVGLYDGKELVAVVSIGENIGPNQTIQYCQKDNYQIDGIETKIAQYLLIVNYEKAGKILENMLLSSGYSYVAINSLCDNRQMSYRLDKENIELFHSDKNISNNQLQYHIRVAQCQKENIDLLSFTTEQIVNESSAIFAMIAQKTMVKSEIVPQEEKEIKIKKIPLVKTIDLPKKTQTNQAPQSEVKTTLQSEVRTVPQLEVKSVKELVIPREASIEKNKIKEEETFAQIQHSSDIKVVEKVQEIKEVEFPPIKESIAEKGENQSKVKFISDVEVEKKIFVPKKKQVVQKLDVKKCTIQLISSIEGTDFLRKNCIENVSSTATEYYGIFFKEELIAVKAIANKKGNNESLKYCEKTNFKIIDGEVALNRWILRANFANAKRSLEKQLALLGYTYSLVKETDGKNVVSYRLNKYHIEIFHRNADMPNNYFDYITRLETCEKESVKLLVFTTNQIIGKIDVVMNVINRNANRHFLMTTNKNECVFKHINTVVANNFLVKNSLFDRILMVDADNYGVYCNNQLLGVASFVRGNNGNYLMARYCSKVGWDVRYLMSELIYQFLRNQSSSKLFVYNSLQIDDQEFYHNLGFKLVKTENRTICMHISTDIFDPLNVLAITDIIRVPFNPYDIYGVELYSINYLSFLKNRNEKFL